MQRSRNHRGVRGSYTRPDLGFDVTSGNNKVGGCPAGFPALAGWDAVTGFGTPVYDKLRALLA